MLHKIVSLSLHVICMGLVLILLRVSAASAKGKGDQTNATPTLTALASPASTPVNYMLQTPSPAPTSTITTSSQLSLVDLNLVIDLNAVSPFSVLHEMRYSTINVIPRDESCLSSVSPHWYAKPTIVEEFTTSSERIVLGSPDAVNICACGYEENEVLNISLVDPFGKPRLLKESVVEPKRDIDTALVEDYCYVFNSSVFEFLPWYPTGTYTFDLSSHNSRLIRTIELVAPTKPKVYYSSQLNSHVLVGFEPFEEVQILRYEEDYSTIQIDRSILSRRVVSGVGNLNLDENGIGLLTDSDPSVALVIIRENFSRVFSSSIHLPVEQFDDSEMYSALNKVIELDPGYVPAYEARAQLYEQQGRLEEAIADYSKVIELDPGYGPAYEARAQLYEQQGRLEEAIADYSKGIELDPNSFPLYYSRAHLYDRLGNEDLALTDFIQAIELDIEQRRNLEWKSGAIEDYTRAIELDPNFALAYYARGEFSDQPIADYSKVIELDPGYVPAYEARAQLYEQQGRLEEAIADYSKVIELDPNGLSAYMARKRLDELRWKAQDNSISTATVNTTRLNMRAGPGTNYSVVGTYPNSTVITVLGQILAGDWYKVEAPDGEQGWMSARYLELNEEPERVPMIVE